MLLLSNEKDIVCQSYNGFTTCLYYLYLAPLLAVKCCAIHTSNKDKNEEIKSLPLSLSKACAF